MVKYKEYFDKDNKWYFVFNNGREIDIWLWGLKGKIEWKSIVIIKKKKEMNCNLIRFIKERKKGK